MYPFWGCFDSSFDSRWNCYKMSLVPRLSELCSDSGGISENVTNDPSSVLESVFNNLISMPSEAFSKVCAGSLLYSERFP